MTTNIHHGSAQIIQFPARTRARVGGLRDERKPAAELTCPRAAKVATGAAWYHEEAIRDGERTRKN
jgi:Protein of unknown function (DUF2735)